MRRLVKADAEHLVARLDDLRLFTNQTGVPYVSFPLGNARHVSAVKGREFRYYIVRRADELTGKIMPSNTIKSVLDHFEAKAALNGRRISLDVRLAKREDILWLDLVDGDRRAVKITAGNWKIVRLKKAIFERYPHQLELCRPQRGGDVREIFDYLNLVEEHQKLLVLAWLGSLFFTEIPRPILHLIGPQGSAKSTQAKVLRSLIDPSTAPTIHLSPNPAELAQVLQHQALPLFDNLTYIRPQIADALCSAVTGAGFTKRELYSDAGDIVFSYRRAMIITSLNVPTNAPDLLDRSILIRTEVPEERRDESEVWSGFQKARGRILGGLLDNVSKAIKLIPRVRLNDIPRMADFARCGTAIILAAGYKKQDFVDALAENTLGQTNEVIQSDPVADAIIELLKTRKKWKGTPTKLLEELNELMDENVRGPGWPKIANHLSRRLAKLIVPMKKIGIEIRMGKSGEGRLVELRRI